MPQPGTPGGYVMAALLVLAAIVCVLAIAEATRPSHLRRGTRTDRLPTRRWYPQPTGTEPDPLLPRCVPECLPGPRGTCTYCGAPTVTGVLISDTFDRADGDTGYNWDTLAPDALRVRLESLEARVAALEARTPRTLREAAATQPWWAPLRDPTPPGGTPLTAPTAGGLPVLPLAPHAGCTPYHCVPFTEQRATHPCPVSLVNPLPPAPTDAPAGARTDPGQTEERPLTPRQRCTSPATHPPGCRCYLLDPPGTRTTCQQPHPYGTRAPCVRAYGHGGKHRYGVMHPNA